MLLINILCTTFQAYEAEVRGRSGGAAKDVHHMLTTLKKSVSNASTMSTEGTAKTSTKPKKSVAKVAPKTKGKQAAGAGKTLASLKAKKVAGRGSKTPSKGRGKGKVQATKGPKVNIQPQSKMRKPAVGAKQANVTKTQTIRKHGKERLAQYKSKTVKRQKLRRERVPETNFALRDYPWSPWKILASSEPRKTLHPVYRAVGSKNKLLEYTHSCAIFKGRTKQPVLYEFAVKPLGCRQKKIVYSKICPKNLSYSTHWADILESSKSLKRQIENIIRKQGGDIFFRRLILKNYKKYENVPTIIDNYDYVWAPEPGTTKYRELMKDSYVISEDMDVD